MKNLLQRQSKDEDCTVALFSVAHGLTEATSTHSLSNPHNVNCTLTLLAHLFDYGLAPKDVMIVVPYAAQKQLYITALKEFAKWAANQAERPALREASKTMANIKVQVVTIDSVQGTESSWVIFDTVVTDRPGFLTEKARPAVACSRAQDALIVIGNPDGLKARSIHFDTRSYKLKGTSLGALFQFCKDKNMVVNWPQENDITELQQAIADATAPEREGGIEQLRIGTGVREAVPTFFNTWVVQSSTEATDNDNPWGTDTMTSNEGKGKAKTTDNGDSRDTDPMASNEGFCNVTSSNATDEEPVDFPTVTSDLNEWREGEEQFGAFHDRDRELKADMKLAIERSLETISHDSHASSSKATVPSDTELKAPSYGRPSAAGKPIDLNVAKKLSDKFYKSVNFSGLVGDDDCGSASGRATDSTSTSIEAPCQPCVTTPSFDNENKAVIEQEAATTTMNAKATVPAGMEDFYSSFNRFQPMENASVQVSSTDADSKEEEVATWEQVGEEQEGDDLWS